ncbi:MAG: thermonuclease family protein [Hyphomicrobiaceae bacterium]
MLRWRKRRDGFEWHDYVRTTILMRRARRRKRLDDAREAAVEGLKVAGAAAAQGASRAGSVAAEGLKRAGHKGAQAGSAGAAAAARGSAHLARKGFSAARQGAYVAAAAPAALWNRASPGLKSLGNTSAELLAPLALATSRPRANLALGALATAAAVAALARLWWVGADQVFVVALLLALIATGGVLLPRFVAAASDSDYPSANLHEPRPRRAAAVPSAEPLRLLRMAAVGIAAAVAVLGIGRLLDPAMPTQPQRSARAAEGSVRTGSIAPAPARPDDSSGTLRGTAIALSGDILRIGRRRVRLGAIEAPERGQVCKAESGRTWRCGAASANALSKIVRRKDVVCEIESAETDKLPVASCRVGDEDVAERLVREGHAFAETGFFSRYSNAESEARQARRGLWKGEAERPEDYRAARWEAARKAAPDGCPIKGRVSGRSRTYVLPWSIDYDRVEVRESRGGRWFCSEAEALSAGWKPSGAS